MSTEAASSSSSGVEKMRVLMLVIASPGPEYDRMKSALVAHYTGNRPPWLDLKFVYGSSRGGQAQAHDYDLHFPSVPETLVPGVFDKTVLALKACDAAAKYDYVVRTNLSTWFHWDLLFQTLHNAPRQGLFAGCHAEDGHLSGYCLVMSSDVTATLLDRAGAAPRSEADDIEISQLLGDVPKMYINKIDVVDSGERFECDEGNETATQHVCVFRHKSEERGLDVAFIKALTCCYLLGARPVVELLAAARRLTCVFHSEF